MRRSGKLWKKVLQAILAVLILGAVGWGVQSWLRARAWQEARARAEAAGVSLVRSDYAGPDIPEDEDLLKNPIFAEELGKEEKERLGEWERLAGDDSGEIRSFLGPGSGETVDYREWFGEEMSREEARERLAGLARDEEARIERVLQVLLSHPRHRFFARADALGDSAGIEKQLESFYGLRDSLADSALMALRSGEGARALRRIEGLDHLRTGLEGPSMLSFVMSLGFLGQELPLIWEGLRLRAWDERHLARLSGLLEEVDVLATVSECLKFETAFFVESCDDLRRADGSADEGWDLTEWLLLRGPKKDSEREKTRAVQGYLDLIEITDTRDRGALSAFYGSFQNGERDGEDSLAFTVLRATTGIVETLFEVTQQELVIARAMVAIERYFLLHGTYPESLSKLDPGLPLAGLAYQMGPGGRPVILADEGNEDPIRWQFWKNGD
jgi:hypothetical protein